MAQSTDIGHTAQKAKEQKRVNTIAPLSIHYIILDSYL